MVAGVARTSVGRYEASLTGLHSNSSAAIIKVLNKRGIRFVEETDEVAAGVFLLKLNTQEGQETTGQRSPRSSPPRT